MEKKGRELFYKAAKLIGDRNKEFVNLVDQFGYTPFLRFVQSYSESVVK